MSEIVTQKWYQKNFWIILLLIVFFPAGLFLMWKYGNWNKKVKIAVTTLLVLIGVWGLFSPTPKIESITLSIPGYQEEYDTNTEIPFEVTVTPENASTDGLDYVVVDDASLRFSASKLKTQHTAGTYEIYVQSGDVKSNVVTITVVDYLSRKKEEQKLAEEQAAKEAEEKRLAEEEKQKEETEAQYLTEEQETQQSTNEQPETITAESAIIAAAGSETKESSDSSENADGSNFNIYNNEQQQSTTSNYVLNTSSMKFHRPSCSSVAKIAPQNYSTSNSSREDLISQGYSPCGKCNP